jgi:hypothetical protein
MAMTKLVTVWFDIVGDGVATSTTVDLSSAGVSFTAGLANGTPFEIGKYINREVSKNFNPGTSPSGIFAIFLDNSTSGVSITSSSLSGTVLTVGFSSAIGAGTAVRVCAELQYA